MKGTIEECQEMVEEKRNYSNGAAGAAVGHGLCAIAYAIRDLAVAIKQLTEKAAK